MDRTDFTPGNRYGVVRSAPRRSITHVPAPGIDETGIERIFGDSAAYFRKKRPKLYAEVDRIKAETQGVVRDPVPVPLTSGGNVVYLRDKKKTKPGHEHRIPKPRLCPGCDKWFVPKLDQNKICSDECRAEVRARPAHRNDKNETSVSRPTGILDRNRGV